MGFFGKLFGKSAQMKPGDDVQLNPLRPEDLERLDAQRAVVRGLSARLSGGTPARARLSAAETLTALQSILDAGVLGPEQTHELQCLGIALGDALVEQLGVEWTMIEDEYGRDPALGLRGSRTLIFPMTMISKRVERGEHVDVFELVELSAAEFAEHRT